MRRPNLPVALFVTTAAACGQMPWSSKEGERDAHFDVPVVDEAAAKAQAGTAPTCVNPSAPAATSDEAKRTTVRTYIRRLMDETRIVPDTAAKKGGPRGSPGSFAKLSAAQVEEFVTAIIKGADLFLPKSLKDEEKYALVCAEISIESAFTPGTSGTNPGDGRYVSVGPLQLTISNTPGVPGMWEDIFAQHAKIPGLTHYDGSPWDTTKVDTQALRTSIHDAIIASLWCITEQARQGVPDYIDGPPGPMPHTMKNAFLAWVIGGPALKSGGDLADQRDAYIASISTDLKMLGFSEALIDSAF